MVGISTGGGGLSTSSGVTEAHSAGRDVITGSPVYHPVNIAPLETNLMSILMPFTDSPYNGGMGLTLPPRFVGANTASKNFAAQPDKEQQKDFIEKSIVWVPVIGAIFIILLSVFLKRRHA